VRSVREGESMTITAGDKNVASEVQASGTAGTRLMNITVRVWRQPSAQAEGKMVSYEVPGVSEHMSFLEMMDVLNERLTLEGDDPIAFDHDCREGICGQCGVVINGVAHGPQQTTTCQLHMRSFKDGDTIDVEPWRADPFPVIKDLVVNRGAFDRIIAAGGYISANTGSAPDAHATPVPKADADHAFDAATCIQCGACVAACPNGSAMLFTAAKVTHLGLLPQGQPERHSRVLNMVAQHDEEGFGGCSNIGECTAVCPKGIPFETISRLNRDLYGALTHPNS
jgi:succinate dehydrogenase / fumarate reductase iron-sulfur subunit